MGSKTEAYTDKLQERIAEIEKELATADHFNSVLGQDCADLNNRIAELEARLKEAEGLLRGLANISNIGEDLCEISIIKKEAIDFLRANNEEHYPDWVVVRREDLKYTIDHFDEPYFSERFGDWWTRLKAALEGGK